MALQIKVRKFGRVTILDLSGCSNLDDGGSALLSARLRRLIADGARHFLLNLEQLTQMDSSGVSVLVETYVSVTNRGGQLKLLRPRQRVEIILQLFRLLDVIPTFEDESEALKSFGLLPRQTQHAAPPLPVHLKYLGLCCG
jgi:anti-sigma B factor antagonist